MMSSWRRTDVRRTGGTNKTDVDKVSQCSPAAGTHAVLEITGPSARLGDSAVEKVISFPCAGKRLLLCRRPGRSVLRRCLDAVPRHTLTSSRGADSTSSRVAMVERTPPGGRSVGFGSSRWQVCQATPTPLPAHPLLVPGTLSGSVRRLTKAGGSRARVSVVLAIRTTLGSTPLVARRAGSPLASRPRALRCIVRCASECLSSARSLGLGSNDTHRSVNRLTRQF
jgi:hypothetical protein